MSRRFAAAIAAGASMLAIAAPAGAARQPLPPGDSLVAPSLTAPVRDIVLDGPNLPAARASATARTRRYPVGDRKGRSVSISVTASCRATCRSADPQRLANFLGTIPHGSEMSKLHVELSTPSQLAASCGSGAHACYFAGISRMLISGNDSPARDGAPRKFVIAHEYGHHLAAHRRAPALYSPAIDWGTPRWASYERVCQGRRKRRYFPGSQRLHYFRNPGEAFAESFAFNRFRNARVKWSWSSDLKPDSGAFAAIRADISSLWRGRGSRGFGGRLGAGRRAAHSIPTPLDGAVSLRLSASRPSRFELRLFDGAGRLLRSGPGGDTLRFDVCGQSRLRAEVRAVARGAGRYHLTAYTP